MLGGVVKPALTEVPQAEYRRTDGYRRDYRATYRVVREPGGSEWWPGADIS